MMSKGFVVAGTVEDSDEDLHDAEVLVRDVGYDDASMIISVTADGIAEKILLTKDEARALAEALIEIADRY